MRVSGPGAELPLALKAKPPSVVSSDVGIISPAGQPKDATFFTIVLRGPPTIEVPYPPLQEDTTMFNRWLPGAAFILTAVLVFGAGCGTNSALPLVGSNGQTSPPTMPPTNPPTAPPTNPPTSPPTTPPTNPPASCSGTNSVVFVNQAQSQAIGLPTVCGIAGSVTVPSNTYPTSGFFDHLNVQVDVPTAAGGPSAPAGTTTSVLSVTLSPTSIIGNGDFNPGSQIAVTLPATIPTSGKSFVMAACSYGGFSGIPSSCSGTVLVNASVNGQTLTFNDPAGFSIRRTFRICLPPPHGPPPHCPPTFAENFVANIYY